VAILPLTMHPQRAQDLRQSSIFGENRTAVAVAAERLGGEEACRGRQTDSADLAAAVARAEGLGRVREHPEPLLAADGLDLIVVGRLTEKIDRNYADRPQLQLARALNAEPQARRIHVERVRQHVDEERRRTDPGDNLCRRRKRKTRA